jgi:hypothetical protein
LTITVAGEKAARIGEDLQREVVRERASCGKGERENARAIGLETTALLVKGGRKRRGSEGEEVRGAGAYIRAGEWGGKKSEDSAVLEYAGGKRKRK